MIWVQGLVCFALWIAYGVIQSRRSDFIRQKLSRMSRQARAVGGAVAMLGGATVLFAALIASHSLGGFTANGMTPLTFLGIAVAGLAFVHAQTMAMAMLVTLMFDGVVTSRNSGPSDPQEPDVAPQ